MRQSARLSDGLSDSEFRTAPEHTDKGELLIRLRTIAFALTIPLVVAACGRSSSTTATPSTNGANGNGTTSNSSGGQTVSLDQGGFGGLGQICKKADTSAYKATDVGVKPNEVDLVTF